MKIYVSNLNHNVGENNLRDLFTPFGTINSVNVITDRETGASRGFAFIEMEDGLAGQNAITSLDQTEMMGRNINVSKARPKEDRGSSKSFGSNNKMW